uniref:Uncharacterized protein n=1 Tax=Oryza meridionalis TaxID=40149 RepID=A0A0E0D5U9_9ORYZ
MATARPAPSWGLLDSVVRLHKVDERTEPDWAVIEIEGGLHRRELNNAFVDHKLLGAWRGRGFRAPCLYCLARLAS